MNSKDINKPSAINSGELPVLVNWVELLIKILFWIVILGICMFFIGLTSAYIVKKGADVASGHWQFFKMPIQFYASTIVIILSSVTILMAKKYFFKGNKQSYQIAMLASSILGTVFLVLQYLGWKQLVNIGIYVGGSMSHANGSFFYVISGAHALHILVGLLIIYVLTTIAFIKQKKIQSKLSIELLALGIQLLSIYWHIIDLIWLSLFIMFLFL